VSRSCLRRVVSCEQRGQEGVYRTRCLLPGRWHRWVLRSKAVRVDPSRIQVADNILTLVVGALALVAVSAMPQRKAPGQSASVSLGSERVLCGGSSNLRYSTKASASLQSERKRLECHQVLLHERDQAMKKARIRVRHHRTRWGIQERSGPVPRGAAVRSASGDWARRPIRQPRRDFLLSHSRQIRRCGTGARALKNLLPFCVF
jgi:hypothetical protein